MSSLSLSLRQSLIACVHIQLHYHYYYYDYDYDYYYQFSFVTVISQEFLYIYIIVNSTQHTFLQYINRLIVQYIPPLVTNSKQQHIFGPFIRIFPDILSHLSISLFLHLHSTELLIIINEFV